MGLTEGHWFEDEDYLSDRQFEKVIEDEKAAYMRGLKDGRNEVVKHGRWIYEDSDPVTMPCSECGYRVYRYNNTHYCPNCGSKMNLDN